MPPINIAKIEQEARRLRAAEMQRIEGLMLARLGLVFRLLTGSILSAGAVLAESVRPLFSWNPQAAARRRKRHPPCRLAGRGLQGAPRRRKKSRGGGAGAIFPCRDAGSG